MSGWRSDKAWSDQFLPEMKSILGLYLIGEPHVDEDTMRNTDLMVLTMRAVRIGCRIRRPGFAEKYGDEFTIRAERGNGTKTELTKIVEGWGDYFFYGHASQDGGLAAWALCAFTVFRLWFVSELAEKKGQLPGALMRNADGSSSFRAFRFSALPDEFIIARKQVRA